MDQDLRHWLRQPPEQRAHSLHCQGLEWWVWLLLGLENSEREGGRERERDEEREIEGEREREKSV